MMELAMMGLMTIMLVTAIVVDLRSGRIPNWLTYTVMGVALLAHTVVAGQSGALFSLGGLGTGLGIFLLMYVSGTIGAGDVKLMAAVGAILGPYGALISALLAIMVGGLYALGAMCYQWGGHTTGRKLAAATSGVLRAGGGTWAQHLQLPFRLRYGVAVAGGTLLFYLGLHPFGG